ncbi:MAG: hypothetical protein CUN57_03485, partial [Phototrophicales bacterium]
MNLKTDWGDFWAKYSTHPYPLTKRRTKACVNSVITKEYAVGSCFFVGAMLSFVERRVQYANRQTPKDDFGAWINVIFLDLS